MASNKDKMNFETQLQLIHQSDFKCVFCGEYCLDFFSDNASVEHIVNHDEDRNDVQFMALAHNDCNKRWKDETKPFDVQKQLEKNKAARITDEHKFNIIKVLVENSPKFALYMTESAAKAQGIKFSPRRRLSANIYAMKVKAEMELKQDAELAKIRELEAQLEAMKNERIAKLMAR